MKASIFRSWPEISIITMSGATSTIRPRKMSVSSRISLRVAVGGRNLDQHQVPLDVVLRADVVDADHRDDLLQLLADLIQHAIVADDDEGHAGQMGVFGLPHRKAVDVVAPRGQHPRNVRKHAGHVLDQSRQHVRAQFSPVKVNLIIYPPKAPGARRRKGMMNAE